MGLPCSASQPPVVSVQVAGAATPGAVVTVTASADSTGANVRALLASVDQGTLDSGTNQYSVPFTAGAIVSGTASWTLPVAPGSYTVSLTSSNCWGTSAPATATVSVAEVQVVPPVVDFVRGPSAPLLGGRNASLFAEAHDPSGGTLSYAWTASGGTVTGAGPAVTWTAPAAPGQYQVSVSVSNGQAAASKSLTLTVSLAEYQASYGSALRSPRRLSVGSSGELFVVDAKGGGVVRLTPSGKVIGSLQVPEPMVAVTQGVAGLFATSASGQLYVLDPWGGAARAVPLKGGPLRMPQGLAFDRARGIVWIAERGANRVRGVRLDGTTALVIDHAGTAPLLGPVDVAFDAASGLLWVAQESNDPAQAQAGAVSNGNNLHAFGPAGDYRYSAVPFGGGAGQVTRVGGIGVDGAGRLFVSDIFQGTVSAFQSSGSFAGTVGQYGDGEGQLRLPAGVAFTPDGGVLVANMDAGRLERFGTGNPVPPPTCTVNGLLDSDCDGLPDWWELKYGLNPNWAGDALLDADGDGLTNLQEYKLGTNPRNPDTDGDGVSDGDEVSLGTNPLDPGDQKPALTVSAPKTSDPGLVRFSATLKGSSTCQVSWSQRLGPKVTLRGAESLTPSFVGRLPGRYQFQGAASCGTLASAPAVLEATVRNLSPRANGGRLLVAHAGDRAVLDGRFSSDANGDGLAYAWDQSAGAPLSGAASGPTLAVKLQQPGYFAFQLTATDPVGAAGTAEGAALVMSSGDDALTAVAASPVEGAVGVPVVLDATASLDPTGAATYAWAQVAGPAVALSGAGTAAPSFTPAQPGRFAFLVTLASGRLRSPPARVEVYAGAGGALPTAAVAQATLSATVGEPVTLDGGASAGSAGGLSYSWRQLSGPAAGLTDADRAVATVVAFAPGAYLFELSVSENGVPGWPVRVALLATSAAPGQGMPVAVAVAPATGMAGTSLSLDGTASQDPDGHFLRYRWTQVKGPWVALDDPTSATPSFRPRHPGSYVFELEVDDQKIRSAAASVTVLVAPEGSAR